MDKHWSGSVKHELGGHSHETPKKTVKEIRTRRGKSGGYIHEHHHEHPEHHPMEEHTSPDQDAMAEHMMQNMGSPNHGEAEADAGTPDAAPAAAAPPAMGSGAAPSAGAAVGA